MPTYRGGAHYTWMILNKNRDGGCFLQNVNENTLQGYNDTNKYYLKKEYKYPKKLITPKDYFNYSCKIEIKFLISFLNKIKKNTYFNLKEISKKDSILLPRLVSKMNSYINWDLDIDEIVRFINAFSNPYPGGQTFINNKKIYLKNAQVYKKNNFHSFTSGIITNIFENKLFICARGGIFSATCNFSNSNKVKKLKVGERFNTNIRYLQQSKVHKKF